MTTSYAPEVRTGDDPKFYGNALRFATFEEAEAYAKDLMGRWLLVVEYRAVPASGEVNYRWDSEKKVAVPVARAEG